jgi:hypothetical protein
VGTEASASYAGQLGVGDVPPGSLIKVAKAVWTLFDNSASSAVAVALLIVPNVIRTMRRYGRRKRHLAINTEVPGRSDNI